MRLDIFLTIYFKMSNIRIFSTISSNVYLLEPFKPFYPQVIIFLSRGVWSHHPRKQKQESRTQLMRSH